MNKKYLIDDDSEMKRMKDKVHAKMMKDIEQEKKDLKAKKEKKTKKTGK